MLAVVPLCQRRAASVVGRAQVALSLESEKFALRLEHPGI
jgi:hypothetical protein